MSGLVENWALHAYVDGELDAAGRASVEKLLAEDAEARAAVEAYRRQKEALRQAYAGVLAEPLPAGLTATLAGRGAWKSSPVLNLAAAIALAFLGGLAGWTLARAPGTAGLASFAGEAIAAHRIFSAEVRHPVEVQADERDHLQSWLSKRVGTPFVIPDLTAEGFALLGGRLLSAEGGPAALLMYEDAEKRRVSMFLVGLPEESEQALRIEQKGRLTACYWLNGRLGLALAGELDPSRLMDLARVTYDQLEG